MGASPGQMLRTHTVTGEGHPGARRGPPGPASLTGAPEVACESSSLGTRARLWLPARSVTGEDGGWGRARGPEQLGLA